MFEEAVRIGLQANVSVGCYRSGGIDSCAVLGLAARHFRAVPLTLGTSDYVMRRRV